MSTGSGYIAIEEFGAIGRWWKKTNVHLMRPTVDDVTTTTTLEVWRNKISRENR